MPLGFEHDALHHGHRLDRIFAFGRLFGEHDRVGALEDGVGDIGDFCARRDRVFDHGEHHLRGGDDRLPGGFALLDDHVLRERDGFERDLIAEISASHHHRVRDGDDLVDAFERDLALDLGDDALGAGTGFDGFAAGQDVFGPADERHGDIFHALAGAELDEFTVAVCQAETEAALRS